MTIEVVTISEKIVEIEGTTAASVYVTPSPSLSIEVNATLETVIEVEAPGVAVVEVFSGSGLNENQVLGLIRSENVFANYKTQEIDEAGVTTYVGQVKTSGAWLLTKIVDTSGDLQINYANISNNETKTTFSSAWTDRSILNYALISSLTGI